MSSQRLELYFAGLGDVQLLESRFLDMGLATPRIAIRGKTPGALTSARTFQWTSAVRGLCVLIVKSVLAHRSQADETARHLVGGRGSLAASLDYAITKQPRWIREIFGDDARDRPFAQSLVVRSNPNRKRPGPVILALNEETLPAGYIELTWNGRPVEACCDLRALLLGLGDFEQAAVSEDGQKPRSTDNAA
jgi:hypothetical protein